MRHQKRNTGTRNLSLLKQKEIRRLSTSLKTIKAKQYENTLRKYSIQNSLIKNRYNLVSYIFFEQSKACRYLIIFSVSEEEHMITILDRIMNKKSNWKRVFSDFMKNSKTLQDLRVKRNIRSKATYSKKNKGFSNVSRSVSRNSSVNRFYRSSSTDFNIPFGSSKRKNEFKDFIKTNFFLIRNTYKHGIFCFLFLIYFTENLLEMSFKNFDTIKNFISKSGEMHAKLMDELIKLKTEDISINSFNENASYISNSELKLKIPESNVKKAQMTKSNKPNNWTNTIKNTQMNDQLLSRETKSFHSKSDQKANIRQADNLQTKNIHSSMSKKEMADINDLKIKRFLEPSLNKDYKEDHKSKKSIFVATSFSKKKSKKIIGPDVIYDSDIDAQKILERIFDRSGFIGIDNSALMKYNFKKTLHTQGSSKKKISHFPFYTYAKDSESIPSLNPNQIMNIFEYGFERKRNSKFNKITYQITNVNSYFLKKKPENVANNSKFIKQETPNHKINLSKAEKKIQQENKNQDLLSSQKMLKSNQKIYFFDSFTFNKKENSKRTNNMFVSQKIENNYTYLQTNKKNEKIDITKKFMPKTMRILYNEIIDEKIFYSFIKTSPKKNKKIEEECKNSKKNLQNKIDPNSKIYTKKQQDIDKIIEIQDESKLSIIKDPILKGLFSPENQATRKNFQKQNLSSSFSSESGANTVSDLKEVSIISINPSQITKKIQDNLAKPMDKEYDEIKYITPEYEYTDESLNNVFSNSNERNQGNLTSSEKFINTMSQSISVIETVEDLDQDFFHKSQPSNYESNLISDKYFSKKKDYITKSEKRENELQSKMIRSQNEKGEIKASQNSQISQILSKRKQVKLLNNPIFKSNQIEKKKSKKTEVLRVFNIQLEQKTNNILQIIAENNKEDIDPNLPKKIDIKKKYAPVNIQREKPVFSHWNSSQLLPYNPGLKYKQNIYRDSDSVKKYEKNYKSEYFYKMTLLYRQKPKTNQSNERGILRNLYKTATSFISRSLDLKGKKKQKEKSKKKCSRRNIWD